MSVDVPILSDYKKPFIRRRLLQTFFGGLGSPSGTRFWYAIFVQIVFYIIPGVIHLTTTNLSNFAYNDVVIGFCNFLFFIFSGSLFYFLGTRKKASENEEHEDEGGLYIIPPKRHKLNVLLHGVLGGLYGYWTSRFLSPEILRIYFPQYHNAVLIFAWFSSLNSVFSMLVGNLPELSMVRPLDNYEISSISRPFIAALCVLPSWILNDDYILILQSSYVVFCLLPFIWLTGMMPTIEPFLQWMGEQLQIYLFGGTASCTWGRFLLYLSLSLLEFFVIFFVYNGDQYFLFLGSSVFGYILSLDLVRIAKFCMSFLFTMTRSSKVYPRKDLPIENSRMKQKLVLASVTTSFWKEFTLIFCFFGLTVFISSLSGNEAYYINLNIMGWIIVMFYSLLNLSNSFQNVYMFFGLIRNPFYTAISTLKGNEGKEELSKILCRQFHLILINFLLPLYLIFYTKCLIISAETDRVPYWHDVPNIVATIRICRWIWQYTGFAIADIAIAHVVNTSGLLRKFSCRGGPALELLIIGFLRDRMVRVWKKIYFVCSLAISSLEDRTSKRSYAGCLFQVNILASPLIFGLVLVSSIFATPLFAFFSLPIYGLAFPRGVRFWPGSPEKSSSGADSVYYEQMTPSFLDALHRILYSSRMSPYQSGDNFLARHEDRIIWVTILEKGNGYAYYRIKGTELQETSCHSMEATRIDDIFREAFEDKNGAYNKQAFHCLTPIDSIQVLAYSDSKNVLTGIVETGNTLELIGQLFLKNLAWYLFKVLREEKTKTKLVGKKVGSEIIETIIRSDSVEAVNLDSWPPSNESTWVETLRKSAYIMNLKEPDDDEISDFDIDELSSSPVKRKGLLPPMDTYKKRNSMESLTDKLENIFLPEGITNKEESLSQSKPLDSNRQRDTFINPSPQSPKKNDTENTNDDTLFFPPTDWFQYQNLTPFRRDEILKDISNEWMSYVTKHLLDIQEDKARLIDRYKHVICGCFASIYQSKEDIIGLGPNLLVKGFQSDFKTKNLPDMLRRSVVTPAFKSAVKIALDELVLFEEIHSSPIKLAEALSEVDNNWFLGSESDSGWNQGILNQVPNLFSIAGVEGRSTRTLYRSRLLKLRKVPVAVGRLNSEVVHGLWASLNLELLYLTNDDDERYSIQAERRLLRNLTIQISDPPLGYPIYSSFPIRRGIE